jgi:hypothetical protein
MVAFIMLYLYRLAPRSKVSPSHRDFLDRWAMEGELSGW